MWYTEVSLAVFEIISTKSTNRFCRDFKITTKVRRIFFLTVGTTLIAQQIDLRVRWSWRATGVFLIETDGTLGKRAVFGHYYQRSMMPSKNDGQICIDTGCGVIDGPLTALFLPEMQYYQVSDDLRSSDGRL